MTVYELIQALTKYDGSTEVVVSVIADGYATTGYTGDSEIDVEINMDEEIQAFDVSTYKNPPLFSKRKAVYINAELT